MAERLPGLAASLPPGETSRVVFGGEAVCIAHSDDGAFYAVADRCSHEDVSLSTGWVSGCEIECPRHNSIFNMITGEAVSLPAEIALKVYSVAVDGDDLVLSEL